MRKFALAIFSILFLSAPAWAVNTFENDFTQQTPHISKSDIVLNSTQTRFDYSGTTSGYPIYTGKAAKGIAASDDGWRICKATDGANGPTLIQCTDGIWDNRASLSYS